MATLPVALGIYATTLYWRLDVLIISAMLSPAAAGSYAIAYYPIMGLASLPGTASVLVLRSAGIRGSDTFRRRLAINAVLGCLLTVVVATVFAAVLTRIPIATITSESVSVMRIAALGLPRCSSTRCWA